MGHRLQVTEHNDRQVNYSYDDLYRLTQEQITDSANGNRTYGYSYDKVSNRLTKVETIGGNTTTTNYAYDANDRLLSETGATTATYTYDNNGNTLSKTENGLTTTYIWNSEPAPRMIGAVTTDANGVVTQQMSYQYDADGMRVSATVNGEETRYLLDVVQPYAQVREEYSPDGTVKVSYVYGNDLIQQTRGTDTTYYHVDGLGSTRVLTDIPDTQGQIVAAYNFDAYGELLNSTGTAANNYLFVGEQYDANLGDYYLRQRYYSPSTGRFGRRDTWEGKLADPMSLHKYGYAHGNPVSFVDPSGLYTLDELGNMIHHQIGLHFQLQDPQDHLNKATIAQILKLRGKYRKGMAGNRKEPDLVDMGSLEIYEIKPFKARKKGADKVITYLGLLNSVDPGWNAGISYSPPSIMFIPEDSGAMYFTFPSVGDGVITYRRFEWKKPLLTITAFSLAAMSVYLAAKLMSRVGLTRGLI